MTEELINFILDNIKIFEPELISEDHFAVQTNDYGSHNVYVEFRPDFMLGLNSEIQNKIRLTEKQQFQVASILKELKDGKSINNFDS